ncbi:MAG: insulinase family protein, partial [Candidatus Aminicenantes bacterium]|nr:insulinase family protein [Candidatus Aminicenantes bacterium]
MISFKIIKRLPIIFFILVFISLPSLSQDDAKTKQFELENGLKVFLYERHSIPLINLAFAVNCGSKDETEKTSGIVHILEHYIMFRGTEFRSGDEVAQAIREHGAYFNAHTSRDLAYFEMALPSENGDFGLQLQKEILFNLKLTQEDLDDEKEVILEEINKIFDDPLRYASAMAT